MCRLLLKDLLRFIQASVTATVEEEGSAPKLKMGQTMTIRGREFSSSEEGSGVWFDGPRLESGVDQLIMSVTWSCRKTSGSGGERTCQDNGDEGLASSNVWVRLMRGTEVVSECEEVFGSVEGEEMARHVVLVNQDEEGQGGGLLQVHEAGGEGGTARGEEVHRRGAPHRQEHKGHFAKTSAV